MTCADCAAAAERLHGHFTGGCIGCCARAASRSPQFFAARKTGRQDQKYRNLLHQFGLTHEQVKAAYEVDRINHKERRA
jgi:hypothetical protein